MVTRGLDAYHRLPKSNSLFFNIMYKKIDSPSFYKEVYHERRKIA